MELIFYSLKIRLSLIKLLIGETSVTSLIAVEYHLQVNNTMYKADAEWIQILTTICSLFNHLNQNLIELKNFVPDSKIPDYYRLKYETINTLLNKFGYVHEWKSD